MAYEVNKFNGVFLTSVADGTIDTNTDLRLVGKNYAGYGEVQNENFVHLLENFANTTAPPKAITGQIWFDTAIKKLKFYDGAKFKTAVVLKPAHQHLVDYLSVIFGGTQRLNSCIHTPGMISHSLVL
jgi:hypothetical protein